MSGKSHQTHEYELLLTQGNGLVHFRLQEKIRQLEPIVLFDRGRQVRRPKRGHLWKLRRSWGLLREWEQLTKAG